MAEKHYLVSGLTLPSSLAIKKYLQPYVQPEIVRIPIALVQPWLLASDSFSAEILFP